MNVKTNLAFVHLDKSEGKQFEASLPNTNIAYYLCILLFLLAPHLTSGFVESIELLPSGRIRSRIILIMQ
ncbi:hypothetical protein, partial [Pluralibacter gergoviae]